MEESKAISCACSQKQKGAPKPRRCACSPKDRGGDLGGKFVEEALNRSASAEVAAAVNLCKCEMELKAMKVKTKTTFVTEIIMYSQ